MPIITFSCEVCGNERSEPLCWHKKRKHHYCSRQCANLKNNKDKSSGLSRAEYEKQYWAKPENLVRKKRMAEVARKKRVESLGESYKREMISRCKARASKKRLDFNIEIMDIIIPKFCPVLNIELKINIGSGGAQNSPSLDRIDNSKGYIKGNVQVISKRANLIKSDASIEEIRNVLNWLILNDCHPENIAKNDLV